MLKIESYRIESIFEKQCAKLVSSMTIQIGTVMLGVINI